MPSAKQQFGTWAEQQAEEFLLKKGYEIIDRHVTSRYGEIDILAQDSDVIVAVEVKARRNDKFGRAAEAVTNRKLQKLADTLNNELAKRNWLGRPTRIDVITIEPNGIDHLIGVGPAED